MRDKQIFKDEFNSLQKAIKEFLGSDAKCLVVFQDLIRKAEAISEDTYVIVTKDFSRYFTRFFEYANLLGKMGAGTEELRYKLLSQEFFKEYFHEDSNDFFALRNWALNLSDVKLGIRINSHLNCIISTIFKSLNKKYGRN